MLKVIHNEHHVSSKLELIIQTVFDFNLNGPNSLEFQLSSFHI